MGYQVIAILVLTLVAVTGAGSDKDRQAAPAIKEMASWIKVMKTSPRGPFARIRWFCKDGSVLPPEPYACSKHGGGRQHGEWTDRTKMLRSQGFLVGNVLAATDASQLATTAEGREYLKHILLEQFLITIDDGWIFRRARNYRGALHVEQEQAAARRILLALIGRTNRRKQDFLLLRDAVRLLPHGQPRSMVTEVRQLSTRITELDKNFVPLRNKIHTLPDKDDARRVREYARTRGKKIFGLMYEHLATGIDRLYKPSDISSRLTALAGQVRSKELAKRIRQGASVLHNHRDPSTRFSEASELLAYLRQNISKAGDAGRQLALLDISLELEREVFVSGFSLPVLAKAETRRHRLYWLRDAVNALYGTGHITGRQWRAIHASINRLDKKQLPLTEYLQELRYLSRVPGWVNRWLEYQYGRAISKLSAIEKKLQRYVPEQMRGSILLVYSLLLDGLLKDAGQQAGIGNSLFGKPVGSGLRSLNPGIARGVLYVPGKRKSPARFSPRGIYLLPETTEKLSRVSGILTLGEGNLLSHVQILANNLGIPNVVVDATLINTLRKMAGKRVVLAVSPGGRVLLEEDGPRWDSVFKKVSSQRDYEIRPALDKLNLSSQTFIPLGKLRSTDAGRLAGPKSANLGELKNRFPGEVTDGLVLPFGVFRQLLNQPVEPGGPAVFEWMKSRYRALGQIKDDSERRKAVAVFLQKLRHWITTADAGQGFRNKLKAGLEKTFGKDGSYSLFIRSDTNIEDLPGFTGAGLNLTVANVSGFDNILLAIHRVWASPFTERAWSWRQKHMLQPEHVYSSVLLMRTVPVDKSGVMVTMDIRNGRPGWITLAVNEGIGGAVSGQRAEELLVNLGTGKQVLLAESTAVWRRIPGEAGGLKKVPVSGSSYVLVKPELEQLLSLARKLETRFQVRNNQGKLLPLDVEFGFVKGKLVLFQVRPYVRNRRAARNRFLQDMDAGLADKPAAIIKLDEVPSE